MRRCLVIDDSPLIRKIVRIVLERHRVAVDEADGVDAGLDACQQTKPDVILLDWLMPGKGTQAFLTGLEAIGLPQKPFVIYVTSENNPIDISRALQAGCDDVLIKPFLSFDLEAKLGFVPAPAPVAA